MVIFLCVSLQIVFFFHSSPTGGTHRHSPIFSQIHLMLVATLSLGLFLKFLSLEMIASGPAGLSLLDGPLPALTEQSTFVYSYTAALPVPSAVSVFPNERKTNAVCVCTVQGVPVTSSLRVFFVSLPAGFAWGPRSGELGPPVSWLVLRPFCQLSLTKFTLDFLNGEAPVGPAGTNLSTNTCTTRHLKLVHQSGWWPLCLGSSPCQTIYLNIKVVTVIHFQRAMALLPLSFFLHQGCVCYFPFPRESGCDKGIKQN